MRASCNTSGADIGRRRKLGRLVDICPVVGDALLAGRISVSHALEIERIRANPRIGHFLTAVASVFVDLAEHHSFDEFHGDIAEFIALTDLDRNDGTDLIPGTCAFTTSRVRDPPPRSARSATHFRRLEATTGR